MQSNQKDMESIKSITIKAMGVRRMLLMPAATVSVFETFLKDNMHSEVVVVNTNLGMEVYYYAENNYGAFIKETALLYLIKHADTNQLVFQNHLNREEVYQSFCQALMTFAQYPQIFLAYTKKFIHLKEQHKSSKKVIPILNGFFKEVLKTLEMTGRMPHYKKIKNKFQKSDPNKKIIKDLISEILLKQHSN